MAPLVSSDDLTNLQTLLRSVNLLGAKTAADTDAATDAKSDPGVQVMESTVTGLAKTMAPAVAALGGISGIGAAIGSFFTTQPNAVRVATVGGASFIFAVSTIALALIVVSDLRARRIGQVAIYEARTAIAIDYLNLLANTAGADGAVPAALPGGEPAKCASASDLALVALAAAHRNAKVIVDGSSEGVLSGVGCAGGAVSLHVTSRDGESGWYVPGRLRLENQTY